MFNRRILVALVACLALSTSSAAIAGGNGGTKKNSTIKVVNSTSNPIYAFVDVEDAKISAAASAANPLAEFKALGGKEIAAGNNSVNFSVLTGKHSVTAVDIVAEEPVGKQNVTTTKGKTSTVTF